VKEDLFLPDSENGTGEIDSTFDHEIEEEQKQQIKPSYPKKEADYWEDWEMQEFTDTKKNPTPKENSLHVHVSSLESKEMAA